jgi:hypothetical protein
MMSWTRRLSRHYVSIPAAHSRLAYRGAHGSCPVGTQHGIERDWASLANEFRSRSLKLILNHGEHAPATKTFDDAHREALDEVLAAIRLEAFTDSERRTV